MILIFIPEIAFTMTDFCSGIYNFPKLSMVNTQGLVTIQVNIVSMYKHICLYIDSIFTWIVTRPCGQHSKFDMKKLDFYFKPTDTSSTKSFDTSQAGVSDSLPELLPSPLDSQKPKTSTHVSPPYPDIGTLYRGRVV
jgi:hypothetical protein